MEGTSKIAALEKQRKDMLASFEAQREALTAETARNRTSNDRFSRATDGVEDHLKRSTYGLVQLSDFKETREKLEESARRDAAGAKPKDGPKQKRKKKLEGKVKLSFAMEDGDEEESGPTKGAETPSEARDVPTSSKRAKLGKNPDIDTTFLPDRERDLAEHIVREQLRKEWLLLQEEMKLEEVEITYSYYDGNGSRKMVTCKKGDTIAVFLEKCRQQFPELRAVSVDNLMYIKEDLILPHHMTFYDCIINKYRGKSGPLFSFDVHDDVRLLADATVEKDESHAGKVVERSWYNRSKHIFPASRWEIFNPDVIREKYTVH